MEPRLSIFLNAFRKTPEATVTLPELIAQIRSDKWKAAIEAIRNGHGDKRHLPAVTLACSCSSRENHGTDIVQTGYVQADIDKLDNVEEIRAKLNALPHIAATFVSPSGKGVKAIVDCLAHSNHKQAFADAKAWLASHGVTCDAAPSNIISLCFVSHDPSASYNAFSEPLPVYIATTQQQGAESKPILTPKETREQQWARSCIAGECQAVAMTGEGGRNVRLNAAALRSHRAALAGGIDAATVDELLLTAARSCGLSDEEARRTIRSGRKAAEKEGPADIRERTATPPSRSVSKTAQPETAPSQFFTLEDLSAEHSIIPPVLIEGCLYQGDKAMFAAPSKMGKTMLTMWLALALAQGQKWMGLDCAPTEILYVDLELQPWAAARRLQNIQNTISPLPAPDTFQLISARGKSYTFENLRADVEARFRDSQKDGAKVIFIDPWYKLSQGTKDENSNRDVGEILNRFEALATEHGLTTIFTHHFAKGDAAAKSSMDRASGAGTFARDVDTLLTFTEHEDEDCFVVESTLRNFRQLPSFVVQRQYPIFKTVGKDPKKIKERTAPKSPETMPLEEAMRRLGVTSVTTHNCKSIAALMEVSERTVWRRLNGKY
jgi:hypothetical protein